MELQTFYSELLNELGFRPEPQRSGNLRFRFEGRFFYVILYPNDLRFFHLDYPDLWFINSPEELRQALEIICDLTSGRKVVKVSVSRDRSQIHASVECFLAEPEQARKIFMRALNALLDTGNDAREQLRRGREKHRNTTLKALVERRFYEIMTARNLEATYVLFHPDYQISDPAAPPDGWPQGVDGVAALIEAYHSAFANLAFIIEEQVVEGLTVVSRWQATGRQVGPLMGLPPGNEAFILRGVSIDQFNEQLQLIRTHTVFDSLPLIRQTHFALTSDDPPSEPPPAVD